MKLPRPLTTDMHKSVSKAAMIIAGTDAMAHLTINFTIDQKGILISVMTTLRGLVVFPMPSAFLTDSFVLLAFNKVAPHFSQILTLFRFFLPHSGHTIIIISSDWVFKCFIKCSNTQPFELLQVE